MRRLLVTGATGFIGSRVTRAALASGWRVAVLACPGASPRRLRDVADRLVWLRGDLTHPASVRVAVARWKPSACIHLAWFAEPGRYLHAPENVDCLVGSLALLQELVRRRCRSVVMAGTCAEYAPRSGRLREDAPVRPATLYGACKLALGEIARRMIRGSATRLAWARIFQLYGPAEDPRRVVPAAMLSLYGGRPFRASQGDQVRDYLHADDVASALLRLAARRADGLFNVCSARPVTIRAILQVVGRVTGRPGLLRFGAVGRRPWDPPRLVGDNRRLLALGWVPRYGLRDGLAQTAAWWRDRCPSDRSLEPCVPRPRTPIRKRRRT